MNILTTNGYVGRFVTDWAGPDATMLKKVVDQARYGPTSSRGHDEAARRASRSRRRGGRVPRTVAVAAKNAWGDHATGTVTVVLPR